MDPTTKIDLKAFQRAGLGVLAFSPGGQLTHQLESYVSSIVNEECDPRLVPEAALERMGYHPAVYLAERVVTGVIRRAEIYSVTHADPKIRKETEEWLWPLLPRLLQAFARAFAYGARGVVFDWGIKDLSFEVPTKDGKKTRKTTKEGHAHYAKVHTIRRSHCFPELDQNDELAFLGYGGEEYGPERSALVVWDPEDEADTVGNGARRRAWRDYCVDLVVDTLETGYLERSVDSPRVAFAPSGDIELEDGTKISVPEYVNRLLMALRGGGAVTFPQELDKNGNKLYDLDVLDLPDREAVWESAIKRREARIFMAYLAIMGGDAAAAAKTLDGLLKEIVQDIASWVATYLTEIVEKVHLANYTADQVAPPEIEATDVGKASAKKILLEALRLVGGDGVARWVDVRKALDRLQVPVVESPDDAATGKKPSGPPRDLSGARDQRRDDARTEEGEEATGAKDEGEEQQQ